VLIAYLNLSSFIVTLGMCAVARSPAQVLSENHMIYSSVRTKNSSPGLAA
jgi:ribose/xylose/arabinose/galactoside ABC-type transport system permease subunit